jgi:hypothetical protein
MINHRHIADRRREIERARRDKIKELMSEYDKKFHADLSELIASCEAIGHVWIASPLSGDSFRQCTVCGVGKDRT